MWLFDDTGNYERSLVSLTLVDPVHEVILNHRRGVHAPLAIVPLNGLCLTYECGLCRRYNMFSQTGVGLCRDCQWCGGSVTDALRAGCNVHFSVRLDRRPF